MLDDVIYSKALEVINHPQNADLRDFINLRLGGFHACGIFLVVIGKRFGSAGFRDVIVEVGFADSTERVLKGKQYNRGLRIAKIVYEALQRVKLEVFENWLQNEGKDDILTEFIESETFTKLVDTRTPESFAESLNVGNNLFATANEFDSKIRSGEFGPMAAFWQSYIDMVQILLDFIRSIRLGIFIYTAPRECLFGYI